jgi:hypothetical protein
VVKLVQQALTAGNQGRLPAWRRPASLIYINMQKAQQS